MKLAGILASLFSDFRSPATGFGSAGIRKQRTCGALTIIPSSLTGLQRGVELAETGIFVRRFEVRYFPEINEKIQNNAGESQGKVVSTVFSRDITVEGEVTGSTGVMAFTINTACTLANDTTTFGGSGIILLDEATETQGRAEWRSVSLKLSSNPLITAV